MLGYISAKQAKNKGLTHHARFCGIPCYVKPLPEDGAYIITKCWLLEPVLSVAILLSAASMTIAELNGIETSGFRIKVGEALK